MKSAAFLLLVTTSAFAKPDPLIILNDVFLNGDGPFRMMVDTGNASSIIRPEVTRRLKSRPVFAVEQATVAGISISPVVMLNEVRAAGVIDRTVEAMVADTPLPGVDGVLGGSWLIRHDYLLDYKHRRIVVDGAPLVGGIRTNLRSIDGRFADGRPIIVTEVDGQQREMVLDSGASTVVLFVPRPVRGALALLTNSGSTNAEGGARRSHWMEIERVA